MFPLNTRQFSSTFLDLYYNSRGYVEEVRSADRDATKRLLIPFLPKGYKNNASSKYIPQKCHPLGNAMWDFARQCTALQCQPRRQSTDLNSPAYCRKFQEKDEESGDYDVGYDDDDDGDDDGDDGDDGDDDDDDAEEEDGDDDKDDEDIDNDGDDDDDDDDDDHGVTDDENFQFSEALACGADVPVCNSVHSAPCFTSNLPIPLACKTTELIAKAPDYNGNVMSLPLDNNIHSDNSSNGASQNVDCGRHMELANASEESELISNCHLLSQAENTHDAVFGTCTQSMGGNFLVDSSQCVIEKYNVMCSEESEASMLHSSDVKKMEYSKERLYKEPYIKPLSFYKQRGCNKKTISTSLTLNLNLEALKSVLCPDVNISRNADSDDVNICGKIAILNGFQKEGTVCISAVESEVIGSYDYISGTVHLSEQGSHPDDFDYEDIKKPLPWRVDLSVDLSAFLDQYHLIPPRASLPQTAEGGRMLKGHSPVAWLLTSPALGVTLDWQVQEEVLKYAQKMSSSKPNIEQQASKASKTDCHSTQWYNILVVVDEYRCVEKDIPLVEVYELYTNGVVNLVNFDLN